MANVDNSAVANDQGGLNYKLFTDEAMASLNTRVQNQVTNQQAVDAISREALQTGIALGRELLQGSIDLSRATQARAIRFLFDTSAEEAVGFSKQIASDLTGKLADIEGLLAAGQQQSKVAQSTAPQTGTGGAFGSDAGSAILQQLSNIQAVLQSLAEKVK